MLRVWSLVKALAAAEALFYVYFRVRLYRSEDCNNPPRESIETIVNLARKCITSASVSSRSGNTQFGTRQFIKGWFKGTDPEKLSKVDIIELLSSHVFYRHPQDLTPAQLDVIVKLSKECEEMMGLELPATRGMDESISFLCPMMGPIIAYHRPLVAYLLINLTKMIADRKLHRAGFIHQTCNGVGYYIRKALPGTLKAKKPVIFFHGITPGLLPYASFVSGVESSRDVIVIELPWVSMSLSSVHPYPREFSINVSLILHELGHDSACFIGHSYGTMVCSWIIRHRPEAIDSLILLDPMPLLSSLPHSAANISLMRSAYDPESVRDSYEQLRYFIRNYATIREIGVAETCFRHTCWTDVVMFLEDLPGRTSVVLSEKDSMLPSRKVKRYIERYNTSPKRPGHHLDVLWLQDHAHGAFLFNKSGTQSVHDLIHSHP